VTREVEDRPDRRRGGEAPTADDVGVGERAATKRDAGGHAYAPPVRHGRLRRRAGLEVEPVQPRGLREPASTPVIKVQPLPVQRIEAPTKG